MLWVNLSFAQPLSLQDTLESANQGDKAALYNLGVIYANGWGVSENAGEAIHWFRQAATQGSLLARYELGLIYSDSDSIYASDVKAYVWLSLLGNDLLSWKNKGCRINIKETVTDKGLKMFEIGRWRYIGDTPLKWCSGGQESFTGNQEYLTTENKKIQRRIFGWLEINKDLEKLARRMPITELGESQFQIASAIYSGKGGAKQNYKEASNWYRRSAEIGNARAQYNLGSMYVNGLGMPQNQIQAFLWWFMAAGQGEKQALESLQSLSKSMTEEQVAQGQVLSTKCWESKFQDCD